MKFLTTSFILISLVSHAQALVINEVLSNPVGDDGGREWIEVYNDSDEAIDIAGLTLSVKGGPFVSITPVSGGSIIPSRGYGIISSTVSGVTKFTQDYGGYGGPLFKSTISLVNTGVTSLSLQLHGSVVDSLSSYTAAKEGSSYSRMSSGFVAGIPSPGAANTQASEGEDVTTSKTSSQTTIPQMSSPSADIVLYLPQEKVVVAGAPALFSVYSLTHAGKPIDSVSYVWSFGDGGTRTGSSTIYRYFYPGRYIAQVEGSNGFIAGTGRVLVRVVSPDLTMSSIEHGKYGSYIDLANPNRYDLDISGWKISIDGALFSFPPNTLLAEGVTRFSGVAMGFASTTVSSSTIIKLLFPSMEELLRVTQGEGVTPKTTTLPLGEITKPVTKQPKSPAAKPSRVVQNIRNNSSSKLTPATTTLVVSQKEKKDTKIATFIKSLWTSK